MVNRWTAKHSRQALKKDINTNKSDDDAFYEFSSKAIFIHAYNVNDNNNNNNNTDAVDDSSVTYKNSIRLQT